MEFLEKFFAAKVDISFLLKIIFPSEASIRRDKIADVVDFPQPLSPTRPTHSPFLILKLILFR